MKTRDEAKACYDFARDEYRAAEEELCQYAAANPEVFEGTDGEFLKSLPKKYIRVKFELNKAKIKADGLDAEDLAALGLVRVETVSMKLKAKAA